MIKHGLKKIVEDSDTLAGKIFDLFIQSLIILSIVAIKRFKKAIILIKEELILFLFVTILLLYLSSVGIYYFENSVQPESFKSFFHCLWWSVITLTTVGYGDVIPITVGGKIFTSIIVLIGLGVVAVPTGLIASALTRIIRDENL